MKEKKETKKQKQKRIIAEEYKQLPAEMKNMGYCLKPSHYRTQIFELPSSARCVLAKAVITYSKYEHHTYVHVEAIHSKGKMMEALAHEKIVKNVTANGLPLSDGFSDPRNFIREKDKYEKMHGKRTGHLKDYHLMMKITIMLPANWHVLMNDWRMSVEEVINLFFEPVANVCRGFNESHPYFVTLSGKGKAEYINVYYSEREFYEEEKTTSIAAASTMYSDPITGKAVCRNTGTGIFRHNKGDSVGTETSHFSPVAVPLLRVSPNGFRYLMIEIKHQMDRTLDMLGYLCPVKLPRIEQEILPQNAWSVAYDAMKINRMLSSKEQVLNDLYFEFQTLSARSYLKQLEKEICSAVLRMGGMLHTADSIEHYSLIFSSSFAVETYLSICKLSDWITKKSNQLFWTLIAERKVSA